MKPMLKMILIAGAAFIAWQWWISRQDGDRYQRDKERKLADKFGQVGESLQLAARPRLSSSENHSALGGILTQAQGLWSRILAGGDAEIPGQNEFVEPPKKNPLIYGYR